MVFAAFCTLIAITFVAMGRTIFPMIWGEPRQARSWPRQTLFSALARAVFMAVLVVLGIYIPAPLNSLLQSVAATLGGP